MQITVGLAVAVTVGNGLTVTVTVAVFVQPATLVPVTVYVVVVTGETMTDEPGKFPGFHTYVEAPLALSVEVCPAQMLVGVAVAMIVGFGFTVITTVEFVLPFALVAVNVTVYVPGVAQVTPVTFCDVDEGGVPLGKVHDQLVGLPVEASVKFTGVPTQTLVALAVIAAVGGLAEETESVISSTAKDGSVPTLSSLFTHLNPIFTFGLLFALAGSTIENAVHRPCGLQDKIVFASGSICAQTVPLKYQSVASSVVPWPFSI
jgi:hypothetical protein